MYWYLPRVLPHPPFGIWFCQLEWSREGFLYLFVERSLFLVNRSIRDLLPNNRVYSNLNRNLYSTLYKKPVLVIKNRGSLRKATITSKDPQLIFMPTSSYLPVSKWAVILRQCILICQKVLKKFWNIVKQLATWPSCTAHSWFCSQEHSSLIFPFATQGVLSAYTVEFCRSFIPRESRLSKESPADIFSSTLKSLVVLC